MVPGEFSTICGIRMGSVLGLLAEVNVGLSWTHSALLGNAKTPVRWDLSSTCSKCFLKCLYSFFPFLLSVQWVFCLLSVGHCLEGSGLANRNEQAFCLLVIPVRLFK